MLNIEKKENEITNKQCVLNQQSIYSREIQTKNSFYTIKVTKGIILNTKQVVAIKSYKCVNFDSIRDFEKEVEILRILSDKLGPFLKFYGRYLHSEYDDEYETDIHELGIIMEYCPKTLADKIKIKRTTNKTFTESEFAHITETLIDGFVLMTEMNPRIHHMDIKPDNIYFNHDQKVLIGDFNVSSIELIRDITQTIGLQQIKGTWAYMAPEVVDAFNTGKEKFKRSKADVFSLGVTILQMYTLDPRTFNEPDLKQQMYQKVAEIQFEWLRNLVQSCLIEDYNLRPTFKDLLKFLPRATINN